MSNVIYAQDGAPTSDPEAQWLLDAVDAWRVSAEKPRYDPGWFHCSQLGEDDATLIAQYRGVLALVPRTARELRVFDNGHDRDGSWKRYLKESGVSVVGEEEARSVSMPYLRLRGTLDDIAHHPETGQWYVVEFKTINGFRYGALIEPMEAHRMQIMSYMAMTSLDHGIILYERKGDQAVRAYHETFDMPLWNGIVKRLLRLRAEAEALDAEVPSNVLSLSRDLVRELSQ